MKNILFDLDGTLLDLDVDEFTKKYFEEIGKKVRCINPGQKTINSIWESTGYMIKNKEINKTNEDCFLESFKEKEEKSEEIMEILKDFYENEFSELKNLSKSNKMAKQSIKLLKQKGYRLVIATNPIFPKDAVIERLKWAELNPKDFEFITSYENMHFCKPHKEYYEEILKNIDAEAEETMMVGNNIQEDMVASELGIKTFLIEDHLIDEGEPKYIPDYKGNFEDFYKLAEELPKKLSKRLQTIVDFIEKGAKVVDIGTDHGYIPVYIVENKISEKVIASDINDAPLSRAKEYVMKKGFENNIETRLGSGLEPIEVGEVDTAVVAGMGGILIARILEKSKDIAEGIENFIFQPMGTVEDLRQYLYENEYTIVNEKLVKEDGKFYQILHVKHGKDKLEKSIHLEMGKKLIESKSSLVGEYLQLKIDKTLDIIKNIEKQGIENHRQRYNEIKERYKQLIEVLEEYES